MPKPTITLYLQTLERKGLNGHAIDPSDLRRHRLDLTPRGHKALAAAGAIVFGRYGERLARLTPDERVMFGDHLQKLVSDQGSPDLQARAVSPYGGAKIWIDVQRHA